MATTSTSAVTMHFWALLDRFPRIIASAVSDAAHVSQPGPLSSSIIPLAQFSKQGANQVWRSSAAGGPRRAAAAVADVTKAAPHVLRPSSSPRGGRAPIGPDSTRLTFEGRDRVLGVAPLPSFFSKAAHVQSRSSNTRRRVWLLTGPLALRGVPSRVRIRGVTSGCTAAELGKWRRLRSQ